jgi:hypothetical protein
MPLGGGMIMGGGSLICTDLDRTLIPNGSQPESPAARDRFIALVERPEITLAYVTGRDRVLAEEAVTEYRLPVPAYVVGDVGTTIFRVTAQGWQRWRDWENRMAPDWAGLNGPELNALFADLPELRLQERSKQARYKLSYYLSQSVGRDALLATMQRRLKAHGVAANLVWSVDETRDMGLLDLLPASATKYHALEFLMQRLGFGIAETVFAGDSGNDLAILSSPIHSVLVANATAEVRTEARSQAERQESLDALYFAKGNFMGMNGNYSAGILEGVAHFLPPTKAWMRGDGEHG